MMKKIKPKRMTVAEVRMDERIKMSRKILGYTRKLNLEWPFDRHVNEYLQGVAKEILKNED